MLEVAFHNPRQHRQIQHEAGPLLLARVGTDESLWRAVDEDRSATAHALVKIVPCGNGIRLHTAGCKKDCLSGRECELIGDCHLNLPARFTIRDTQFEVVDASRPRPPAAELLEILVADKSNCDNSSTMQGPSPATLTRWFDALGTLQCWASSVQEFFVQAARCAVDSIGLDGAVMLRRRDESWEIAASYLPHPEFGIHCDTAVLDKVLDTPRTLFHGTPGAKSSDTAASTGKPDDNQTAALLVHEVAVVVSPVLNMAHELAGAIYGFRSVRAGNARRGIRYLEAHLIELLAGAVSDGITRLEREAAVDRRRVLMEKALAAAPDQHSQRLASEQREITLLFADLRRFSQITHSLSTQQTFELLADVMESLSAAVMEHDGLIIDYYGDGLAAMWNAPADQPEHPELACRAALRMLETLPAVRRRWADVVGDELRLGIGVHTGIAQVGNAGSSLRTKYGPRGTHVHLASRVEAATKAVGVPLLVTGAVAERLSNRLAAYRLCRVQLPGISESVDLYGVRQPSVERPVLAQLADYERALQLFEAGELDDAAQWLAKLEPAVSWIPVKFLADQIELANGQRQGRRSTDRSTAPAPIVTLNVK